MTFISIICVSRSSTFDLPLIFLLFDDYNIIYTII